MKFPLEKNLSQYFLKIKKIIPQAKPRALVGLDIGTTSIKVARISNSAQKHEIDAFAIEPINQDDLKSVIANCLAKANISTKLVNTSVSGQGVVIRYVQMPKMPLADIKSSISLEADKYFPFPIEEVGMDCCILEEIASENKVLVLVAAAKKELIEQRLTLLSSLGLEAETIYTDSIAIANVFKVLGSNIKESDVSNLSGKSYAKAVLNIGGEYSNLNIIKDDFPRFTRDIYAGGNDLTKRICHIFGIDMKAAEELKISSEEQKEKIMQACESVLNNLIAEIRLSFDYFETENNIPVGILYLSGGGACLAGLEEFMKQNLGIEVKLWQPFSGLSISSSLSSDGLACVANKLSIAIGLALK